MNDESERDWAKRTCLALVSKVGSRNYIRSYVFRMGFQVKLLRAWFLLKLLSQLLLFGLSIASLYKPRILPWWRNPQFFPSSRAKANNIPVSKRWHGMYRWNGGHSIGNFGFVVRISAGRLHMMLFFSDKSNFVAITTHGAMLVTTSCVVRERLMWLNGVTTRRSFVQLVAGMYWPVSTYTVFNCFLFLFLSRSCCCPIFSVSTVMLSVMYT